jgi:hypothetical protein
MRFHPMKGLEKQLVFCRPRVRVPQAMTDYEGTECVGVGGRTPRCLLGRQTHIRRLCEDRVLYGGCQRDVIWRPGRLPIWG